jgi:putative methionine-R-sulfoxide reductase with GAF domain
MSTPALEAINRILESNEEADDALRETVSVLAGEPGIAWAAIAFLEDGDLVVGPSAGAPGEERRLRVPIAFHGELVGELWVDGEADPAFLERVAVAIAGHVLIGWDTGGDLWDP